MREIKFRGRTLNNGEWAYGYLVCHPGSAFILPTGYTAMDGTFYVHEHMMVDPATVGQYTGLRDKHGVEIYESDIVLDFDVQEIGVVCYHDACFWVKPDELDAEPLHNGTFVVLDNVHDNIHDNPEMMGGGEDD